MATKKTSPDYKAGYKQGYNDRKDEQLGAKRGKEKARRRSFKARHAKNIQRGKMSAAYWADKVKW